ncbi:hypothetical protein PSHT_14772 [Puccinia striiformis]|uniref:Uncharacterized protein n=1 Tax=Puccinia striiformis TaxID=27350 RepID=A0A2S4UIT7_9BASI|nr:hypothetical protein PSHT_14772 [Puccinia striiformis]
MLSRRTERSIVEGMVFQDKYPAAIPGVGRRETTPATSLSHRRAHHTRCALSITQSFGTRASTQLMDSVRDRVELYMLPLMPTQHAYCV